jgi:uncharacterized protein YbdZ (MbtH family)
MHIIIEVPDDIAHHLQARWSNLEERSLKALALEAYRLGALNEAQVQCLLNLPSRWDVEKFLQQEQAYLDYTEADLEGDIHAIRYFRQR